MAKDGLWEGLDLVEMYKVVSFSILKVIFNMNLIIISAAMLVKVYKHDMC